MSLVVRRVMLTILGFTLFAPLQAATPDEKSIAPRDEEKLPYKVCLEAYCTGNPNYLVRATGCSAVSVEEARQRASDMAKSILKCSDPANFQATEKTCSPYAPCPVSPPPSPSPLKQAEIAQVEYWGVTVTCYCCDGKTIVVPAEGLSYCDACVAARKEAFYIARCEHCGFCRYCVKIIHRPDCQ